RLAGGGEVDGGPGEVARRGMLTAPRQRLGPHLAPGDRRVQVVAGERLALVAERLGLHGATLCQERATEQRRGARGIDPEAVVAEALVRRPQTLLRGGGVPLDQRDAAGETLGLEQPLP